MTRKLYRKGRQLNIASSSGKHFDDHEVRNLADNQDLAVAILVGNDIHNKIHYLDAKQLRSLPHARGCASNRNPDWKFYRTDDFQFLSKPNQNKRIHRTE